MASPWKDYLWLKCLCKVFHIKSVWAVIYFYVSFTYVIPSTQLQRGESKDEVSGFGESSVFNHCDNTCWQERIENHGKDRETG